MCVFCFLFSFSCMLSVSFQPPPSSPPRALQQNCYVSCPNHPHAAIMGEGQEMQSSTTVLLSPAKFSTGLCAFLHCILFNTEEIQNKKITCTTWFLSSPAVLPQDSLMWLFQLFTYRWGLRQGESQTSSFFFFNIYIFKIIHRAFKNSKSPRKQ